MNWLLLSAFLQFGAMRGDTIVYQLPDFIKQSSPPFYTMIGAEANIGPFFIKGFNRTDIVNVNYNNFDPMQMTFNLNTGLRFDKIEIGYSHTCYHPLAPYMEYYGYKILPSSEGSVDDFYLRIDIKEKP
jgi:hypothetical protein